MSLGRFTNLCSRLKFREKPEDIFTLIRGSYQQDGRYYHNLKHVYDSLKELDGAEKFVKDKDALEFAIWFHDIVYDVRKKDNEEQSCLVAVRCLSKNKMSKNFMQNVSELIIATKHQDEPSTKDQEIIMDIDLSVLGKDESEYKTYSYNIIQEYRPLIEEVGISKFYQGRKKFLESLLDRKSTYFTEHFFGLYAKQAQKNISDEVSFLEQELSKI